MKQYPYMITYTLPTTGNKHHFRKVQATHQAEAKKLFEAEMPSAKYICSTAMPQNKNL